MHLQAERQTFRVQFIQRFLTGPESVSWRPIASAILKTVDGLNMDKSLFLLDPKTLSMTNFPFFYRNLFKVWNLFQFQRTNDSTSLHWLLEEPLVYGARLDLTSASASLTGIFTNAKVVTLRQLLNLAGPDFVEVDVVATKLGLDQLEWLRNYCKRYRLVSQLKRLIY